MEMYQPREPRRGVGFRAAIFLVLVGLMFGALGGGLAGAWVAASVVQRNAAPTAVVSSAQSPAPAAPVVQTVVTGETNSAPTRTPTWRSSRLTGMCRPWRSGATQARCRSAKR